MENTKVCESGSCESCMMPFSKDPKGESRESDKYCSLCFNGGKLCYEGDLKGFQQAAYKSMRERGISWPLAKLFTFMIRFAPRWKSKV